MDAVGSFTTAVLLLQLHFAHSMTKMDDDDTQWHSSSGTKTKHQQNFPIMIDNMRSIRRITAQRFVCLLIYLLVTLCIIRPMNDPNPLALIARNAESNVDDLKMKQGKCIEGKEEKPT